MMRARRHIRRPPDLTSLFDVLFIIVFAALIRAAAVERDAATPPSPPSPPRPLAPAVPPPVAALRQRALADLDAALAARTPLVVRVTRDGTIDALEVDGKRIPVVVPLLEPSSDPALRVTYASDRSAERRVCRIVARQLGAAELARYLVIVAPAAERNDLPEALLEGLEHDLGSCVEQHGIATLVYPTMLQLTPTRGTP
jgi:hypothetical protein